MRIVLDTNILISFLIGKAIPRLQTILADDRVRLVTSSEQVMELLEVTGRKKFERYFSVDDIEEMLNLISDKSDLVSPQRRATECRDSKDNFLLDICVSGNSDYLITGDFDLLVLNPYKNVQIINIREFEEFLNR